MPENNQSDIHQNKIYCGTDFYLAMRAECGVLHGSSFRFKHITFVQDENLHPRQLLALDSKLKPLLDELKERFEA
ncbi:hypothetical protein LY624_15040 [Pseudoalteromonas sp. N1230-9]|uniref:hypothetical protein n=1 Tax=Pseudoalteromonas sp. N1230-9 TaxID=2907156 RepID=UPI002B29F370|nr:hypothetical protein LY624_15040 [Pseudoalteromonas sp. N1230-9]